MIGKWPGGRARLWGGPYTMTQMAVLLVSLAGLLLTSDLWAHFGLGNILIAIGVPYGLSLLVRHVRVDGRNPLAVAVSAVGLLTSPAAGRLGGRPLAAVGRYRPLIGVCTVTVNPGSPDGTSADRGPVRPVRSQRFAAPALRTAMSAPRAGIRSAASVPSRAGTGRAPVSAASALLHARRQEAVSRAGSSRSTKTNQGV
ncbi:hypothetical protein [Streptomyces finlayi]|uniref:hypothetical protein n=1 Tax=Streptomyces finlayi TaxID=67296 RepID=UPI001677A5D7|nr:hypothetical protein [Streptomyces finlayi]